MQILAAALLLALACRHAVGPTAVIRTARGPIEVALEIADTEAARNRGLMYRKHLADGTGMLFVFTEDENHVFWMKNTFIPLDMIFIAADGRIVGVRADTTPFSTAGVGVGVPSRFVLEVPGGWSARRGVATGDRVELRGVRLP
ncbi:MAG TPA: DUF192 domain-containing protein [Candidatus Binatia bacterium]|nr:DUF192 domain-containing protein [Candidatus Binatia bacterium]